MTEGKLAFKVVPAYPPGTWAWALECDGILVKGGEHKPDLEETACLLNAWASEKVRVAVLAERERCAKIAESNLPSIMELRGILHKKKEVAEAYAWAGKCADAARQDIAREIRDTSQPEAKAGEAKP